MHLYLENQFIMYLYLENQFTQACYDGDIIFVKELLFDNPNINISVRDEEPFIYACGQGHLAISKWLLKVRPQIDISAQNDDAFKWACWYGHLEIAVWLQTLKPYLYVINYNADGEYVGFYIRTKEESKEARWQQTKYLVWLSDPHSPNKQCIWFKLPNDISRYIIQNFI